MKSVIGIALMAALVSPTPVWAQPQNVSQNSLPQNPEIAEIKTAVESVATLADRGNFESLERLFADRVEVDYTSLFGGDVQIHTPESLMNTWAATLPGFDRTRHAISGVQVEANGDRAMATAQVRADHYLNGEYWQVSGRYEYQLLKQEEGWQITQMTFNLAGEEGDRDLLELATEKATQSPVSYRQRQQTQQTVRDFLTSLETKDMDAFAAVWAEDAVQDMPFSPMGFPKRVEGRDNLIQHYAAWPEISGSANFTDHLVFYPMQDPTMVFAQWRSMVEILPTQRTYNQTYGGLFQVVDGKIELFREYYDPIVFIEAFGLNEGEVGRENSKLKMQN